MDSRCYTFLKMIYDGNRHGMYMWDKKFPFAHGYTGIEARDTLAFLRDNGYVDQKDAYLKTTIAGNEYVENKKRIDNTYRLSIAAIVISFIALLKPPSFDIIAILISIVQAAK